MMTPSREKRVHQSVSIFPISANGFRKPSSRARRRAASKAKACLKDIESARLARRWKQVSGDPRLEPFQKLRSPPFPSVLSMVRPCPVGPRLFSTRAFRHIRLNKATLTAPMLSQYKGWHSEDASSDLPTQTRCGLSTLR